MAKAYLTLERARGAPADRVLVVPEDRANAEAMAPLYRAMGRPDTPEAYGVSVADGSPELARAFAADLPAQLHPLGVSKAAMDKVVELVNTHATNAVKAENDRIAADQAKVDEYVRSQWGDNADAMRKQVTELLRDAAGKDFDALAEELSGGLGKSPVLFKFLAGLVNQRAEGGTLPAGGQGGTFRGIMSVADAQTAKNAFLADKSKLEAWRTKGHPQHDAAVAEFNRYNEIIVTGNKK